MNLNKSLILPVAVVACISISYSANAGCTSKYDWQSGNNYTVCSDSSGTSISGYNAGTGSTWNQRQNRDGSYSGRDAGGNYYTGNNNTGSYYNYGTGKSCYGTGAFRTCY